MSASTFAEREIKAALTVLSSGRFGIEYAYGMYENGGGLESFEDFKKAVNDALKKQQPAEPPVQQASVKPVVNTQPETVAENTVNLSAGAPTHVVQPETSANETPAPKSGGAAQEAVLPQGNLQSRYAEYCVYLTAIFRPGDVLCFVSINHAKEDGKNTQQIFATLGDALTWESFQNLIRDNANASIYVAINTYPASLVGQRKGRTQENVVAVRALQSDMDDAQQAANIVNAMQTSTKVPPPSIVVESSPGKRQGIWLVDGIAKDEAKPLMQAIAAEFKTDSAVAEVARVMRLPGFVNRKYATEPVAKLLVNTGARYTRESFKIDLAAAVAKSERTSPEEYLDAPFIRKGGPYGGIYPQVLKIVGHYHETKNINDGDVMFSIVKGHIEKNGCYLSDGTTPFAWDENKVRNQCHKLIDEFDKKKDHEQAATTNDALSEAKIVSEQAAALAAAIPADQIVTTPQEWPTVPGSNSIDEQTLFVGEPRQFNPREYALQDLYGQPYSGWFPLGRISLVSGASGAMKTTFLTQALVAGRDGETFLGHKPGNMPFLFLFADRGKYDCEETLQRMNLVGKVPHQCINGIPKHLVPKAIADVAATNEYKILVIDGGDLLVPDNNKGESVGEFTTSFQQIAEHYGVGLIVTTGAGKMSPQALKQGAERRSISKGSEVWGRTVGSVFTMNSEHDGTKDTRRLVVQHRNAATEKFLLQVKDGRLVPVNEAEVAEASAQQNLLEWVAARERFTGADIRKRFKWNGDTSTKRLAGLIESGIIKRRERKDKVWYEVPATIKSLKKAVANHEKIRAENTVSLKSPTEPAKPAETEPSE